MSSEAQRNEKIWAEYCQKLAKAGLAPTELEQKGYIQQRRFWNTVDTDANQAFNQLLQGERKEE